MKRKTTINEVSSTTIMVLRVRSKYDCEWPPEFWSSLRGLSVLAWVLWHEDAGWGLIVWERRRWVWSWRWAAFGSLLCLCGHVWRICWGSRGEAGWSWVHSWAEASHGGCWGFRVHLADVHGVGALLLLVHVHVRFGEGCGVQVPSGGVGVHAVAPVLLSLDGVFWHVHWRTNLEQRKIIFEFEF